MFRSFMGLIGVTVITASIVAAPKPKEKEVDHGPITDEQLRTSSNNLKHLGLAFHNYHDTFGELPNNVVSKDGKALLSWRVQLLPFLEEAALYKQFRMDEPWDSDHNKTLIEKMPKVYTPVRGKTKDHETFYQVIGGKSGMFPAGARVRLATIPDGTSNTFMAVEAARSVIWTKPDDLEFDKQLPKLGGMFNGSFHVLMGDGSVMRLKKTIDDVTLSRLICPNDGNAVDIRPAIAGKDDR